MATTNSTVKCFSIYPKLTTIINDVQYPSVSVHILQYHQLSISFRQLLRQTQDSAAYSYNSQSLRASSYRQCCPSPCTRPSNGCPAHAHSATQSQYQPHQSLHYPPICLESESMPLQKHPWPAPLCPSSLSQPRSQLEPSTTHSTRHQAPLCYSE